MRFVQNNSKSIRNIICCLYGATFIFVFFTMDYFDGRINANIGYRLAEGLVNGDLLSVYNSIDYSYGVTIYLIYAVWSIPLAGINALLGRTVDITVAVWEIYWYKILLLLFLIGCSYQFYKIIKNITGIVDAAKQFTFLFLTSSIAFFPVLALTQCDVMNLFFILLGINFLLEDSDTGFAVSFAIASTMKYLALFIFIPLIFLKYKNLKEWVKFALIEGIIMGVSLGLKWSSEVGRKVAVQEDYYVSKHITAVWDNASNIDSTNSFFGMGSVSGIVMYFLSITILAYLLKNKNHKDEIKWVSWVALAAWYTLFVFYGANTYWYVLLAPFMILILLNNDEYFRVGLFVEIILTNLMLIERILYQPWVFGGELTFSRLCMKSWSNPGENILYGMFDRVLGHNFDELHVVFTSIVIVLAFLLLVLFFPRNCRTVDWKGQKEVIDYAIGVHILILALWVLCMVLGNWYLSR